MHSLFTINTPMLFE